MRFGFLGQRGLNEFVNEQGEGFYFTLRVDGVYRDRFFLNVGQPDPRPPCHPWHVDDPRVCDQLRLGACSFKPFRACYRLGAGNYFYWSEEGGTFQLNAFLTDELQLCSPTVLESRGGWFKLGKNFWLYGATPGQGYRDNLELWVAAEPGERPVGTKIDDYTQLPQPENPALCAVFYNLTTCSALRSRLYVPVNKSWTAFMSQVMGLEAEQEPLIFGWDTACASIILAEFDLELAQRNLLALLEGMTPQGRIPQIRIGERISNRTSPPLWFLALEKLCEKGVSRAFVEEVYPKLLANYHWFKRHRMNGNYTFSWGSDEEQDPSLLCINGRLGAILESGQDDSPLFDDMQLVGRRLDHACIDLSCVMYRAVEVLLRLAGHVSLPGTELRQLKDDQSRFAGVLPQFFSTKDGWAQSFKGGNGQRSFAAALTPVSFYPLLCDSLSKQHLALLRDLYHSQHFENEYGLASLSCADRRFTGDGDYWRGRIWPPHMYLAALGFQRYLPDIYQEIKGRAFNLLLNEWQRHGHVHENYSALSGWGEPQPGTYARSCPLYSWGGLLGVI